MAVFALIDCDNFFASCEKIFDPKIRNRPIVVLSNNDGAIVARSKEVKQLGIPAGIPYFKVEPLLRNLNVVVRSSNFQLYGDMSRRVMSILSNYSPFIEVYSIDEAFLELSQVITPIASQNQSDIDLSIYCTHIREQVIKHTGVPISIGIATTKTLSKVACKIAKRNPHFKGVYSLVEKQQNIYRLKENFQEHLKELDVNDIWGIGRNLSKKLYQLGINTAYDLISQPDKKIRKLLTVTGLRTVYELRGTSVLNYVSEIKDRKSIIHSRSFSHRVKTHQELEQALVLYASHAAESLREEGLCATNLFAYAHSSRFDQNMYFKGVPISFPYPTSNTNDFIREVSKAVKIIFQEGVDFRKAGVTLTGLYRREDVQYPLFSRIDNFEANNRSEKSLTGLNLGWSGNNYKSQNSAYYTDTEYNGNDQRLLTNIAERNFCSNKVSESIEKQANRTQEFQNFDFNKIISRHEKDHKLMLHLDLINRTYGKDTIFPASAGTVRKWRMAREFISKRFTTNWDELPSVK